MSTSARVGADPIGVVTMYVDSYGDNWAIGAHSTDPGQGILGATRERDKVFLSANTLEDLRARIEAYARDTRANPGSLGSVLGAAGAAFYLGHRYSMGYGILPAVLASIAAAGAVLVTKADQYAGALWNAKVSKKGREPLAPLPLPGGAATKGCSCSHDESFKSASVGRSPYSLHHANASRFKAAGELALLEDHMINDPCPDCMNKHAMMASRLMAEAATLEEGERGDIVGAELIEQIRQQIKPEPDIALANQARDVRKTIQQKLKLSHAGHSAH